MASLSASAVSMVLLFTAVTATDYTVGDDKGWTTKVNYSDWAKDKTFVVGDRLVFNYNNAKHNVFKVNGTMFQECTVPDANQALTSGHEVITLSSPGEKWYICGVSNHCSELGMKLTLNVMPSSASSLFSSVSLLFLPAMLATLTIFL